MTCIYNYWINLFFLFEQILVELKSSEVKIKKLLSFLFPFNIVMCITMVKSVFQLRLVKGMIPMILMNHQVKINKNIFVTTQLICFAMQSVAYTW